MQLTGSPRRTPPTLRPSFDYSFDTGTAGGTPQTIQSFLASGGQFIFKIDTDPTQKNDPLTLHAVYDAAAEYRWIACGLGEFAARPSSPTTVAMPM